MLLQAFRNEPLPVDSPLDPRRGSFGLSDIEQIYEGVSGYDPQAQEAVDGYSGHRLVLGTMGTWLPVASIDALEPLPVVEADHFVTHTAVQNTTLTTLSMNMFLQKRSTLRRDHFWMNMFKDSVVRVVLWTAVWVTK
ncbi:hypothetical protein JCM3774_001764 [Rhodotorula dairenensis]